MKKKNWNIGLIFISVILIINLVIFTITLLRKFYYSSSEKSHKYSYGENLANRILKAGLENIQSNAQSRLIFFIPDSAFLPLTEFEKDFQRMNSLGIDILIVLGEKIASVSQDSSSIQSRNFRIVNDLQGKIYQAFALAPNKSHLLLYHLRSNQILGILSPINDKNEARDAFFKVASSPFLASAAANSKKADFSGLSPTAKKIGHFPFDSLLEKPRNIIVDLDKIKTTQLHFVKEVGNKEFPEPGDLMLSSPSCVLVTKDDKILITDEDQNTIFALDKNGNYVMNIGGEGQGPGEFVSPLAISNCNNKFYVVEGCLRIQEFDKNFKTLHTYALSSELPHYAGFGLINNVLFVPSLALPPLNTKLINAYDLTGGRLQTISSFFRLVDPGKKTSNKVSAILSYNQMRFSADGERFLAFGRVAEKHLFVIDLMQRIAYKISLKGREIDHALKIKRENAVPDFAVRFIYKDIAFENFNKKLLYVLTREGVLEIPLQFENEQDYAFHKYKFQFPDQKKSYVFGGFEKIAVARGMLYGISVFASSLTIFQL